MSPGQGVWERGNKLSTRLLAAPCGEQWEEPGARVDKSKINCTCIL